LFFAGAYLASLWVGSLARKRLEDQTGALYQQYALQVSNALDSSLYDRLQWLRAMADVFAAGTATEGPARQRALLDRWKASLPELAWVAYADRDAAIVAATGPFAPGARADQRRWFVEGAKQAWIGDVRPTQPGEPGSTAVQSAAGPARRSPHRCAARQPCGISAPTCRGAGSPRSRKT
jgi:hypothetical protein